MALACFNFLHYSIISRRRRWKLVVYDDCSCFSSRSQTAVIFRCSMGAVHSPRSRFLRTPFHVEISSASWLQNTKLKDLLSVFPPHNAIECCDIYVREKARLGETPVLVPSGIRHCPNKLCAGLFFPNIPADTTLPFVPNI
jgi:hypothetical protein